MTNPPMAGVVAPDKKEAEFISDLSSAAWMSALAFVYNYLGQRELAKRVESLVQDNDLIDKSNDEDAPADDAKGAKTDDVTATVKLRNGSANSV